MQPVPGYGTPFPQGHGTRLFGVFTSCSSLAPAGAKFVLRRIAKCPPGEADRMKQAGVGTWSIGPITAFLSCDFHRRHGQGGQVAFFSVRVPRFRGFRA